MTDDLPAVIPLPKIHRLADLAKGLAKETGEDPAVVLRRLQDHGRQRRFRHIYFSRSYWLTDEMVVEFLAQYTRAPKTEAEPADPLAAKRASVARKRKTAPKQRGRTAA